MGFETVVRPVVFPNIRPAAARALRIEDAPDKGIAVITGGSNSVVDIPLSYSSSWSKHRMVEVKRTYDKVRIYYTRPDGTLDQSKYWEFEVLRSIQYLENGTTAIGAQFAPFQNLDNVEIIDEGLTRYNK
jgi:hypothetical protein